MIKVNSDKCEKLNRYMEDYHEYLLGDYCCCGQSHVECDTYYYAGSMTHDKAQKWYNSALYFVYYYIIQYYHSIYRHLLFRVSCFIFLVLLVRSNRHMLKIDPIKEWKSVAMNFDGVNIED